ncbi:hypothetical protein Agub_g13021 [Astrephomene gubernaculifera]|uniref:B9 domain-containing protein 2 n=1 Tax=Astrephomene gubernaculifera TaxID=47775 RepID=A0AAD3E162_9CHLO|nr:hypothetical protein Agub_g13021 [Astrephomene gubernaculifera]
MSSQQQPSLDLANLLPGPRFHPEQQTAGPLQRATSPATTASASVDEQAAIERRDARRERRRLAQASPGESRNARHNATGDPDSGLTSPARQQLHQHSRPPQVSPPAPNPADVDMSRYGLAVDSDDVPSPTSAGRPRRRMSPAGQHSPEVSQGGATPSSEAGSELGSPGRRMGSRTDMHSSYDSLDSLSGAAAGSGRGGRRGSGFRRAASAKPVRSAAPRSGLADVHVVGEIVGASGFSAPMLFCRWQLLYEPGKSWRVQRGLQQGATHACCSGVPEEDLVVWEHPLDLHLQTQSLQGWPALLLMVYARDEGSGRDSFLSYALVSLPTTPGLHHVSSHTWFAVESNRALGRSFFAWYTGLIPRLEDETFITDLRKREDAGPFICTVGAGQVHLRLNILTRNLEHVSHQGGESLAAALERLTTNIMRASTQLANKSAALEEHRRSSEVLSEGQRLVRGGREERLASARAAVEARRRGDGLSPVPSESGRTPSHSSFRGFGGESRRVSRSDQAAAQDDMRSESSYDRGYGGGPTPPRDRYADRAARRARDRATRETTSQEGGSVAPSASTLNDPPSRGPSTTGAAPGAAAGRSDDIGPTGRPARGSAAREQGGGGGVGRAVSDDDGVETVGEGIDEAATAAAHSNRAAARAARREQQRVAF